jgi:glycosyltransferase involved in cell wall biosynthesis
VRIVVCDNGLWYPGGHHPAFARGFAEELRRHRVDVAVWGCANVDAETRRATGAQPVFRENVYSFAARRHLLLHATGELGGRFASDLAAARPRTDDVLFFPNARPPEMYGVGRWLAEGGDVAAVWLNVMADDLTPRRDGRPRPVQAALYRSTVERLARRLPGRLVVSATSPRLVERLEGTVGRPVVRMPMPKSYFDASPPPRSGAWPTVVCPGGPRYDKGTDLLPSLVRACRNEASFVVQSGPLPEKPAVRQAIDELRTLEGVELVPGPLPRELYESLLARAHLVLLPYRPRGWQAKTSGVFAEAVALGRPVVVPPGSWMASEIAAGRAAGVAFAEHTPNGVVTALRQALARLDALTEQAGRLAPAWRERNGMPAFVDRLLAELERACVGLAAAVR